MKKRVLSLLMALAMCLSMLPATALAEELGTGAAETQTEQQVPEKPKQEEQPVEDQKQEEESDDPVQAAQALINALPEEVTAENADEIEQQLMALEAALEKLTEAQQAALDMTRYEAVCEALTNLTAEQEEHTHTIKNGKCSTCGAECPHDQWKDGKCTACGYACTHDDGVDADKNCTDYGIAIIAMVTAGETITYHADIAGALEAAKDNGTVKIIAAENTVTLPDKNGNPVLYAEGTLTLDLNGHTLNGGGLMVGGYIGTSFNTYTGNLTVIDSAGGGKIEGKYTGLKVQPGANVKFDGQATTTCCKLAVYSQPNQTAEIKFTGGVIHEIDKLSGTTCANLLAAGYCFYGYDEATSTVGDAVKLSTLDGKTETTTPLAVGECSHLEAGTDGKCLYCGLKLAVRDSKGAIYDTLQDAINAAAADSSIQWLMLDADRTENVTLDAEGKSITVRMNGKTLTAATVPLTVKNGTLIIEGAANITQTDTTSDASGCAISITGGELIFKGALTAQGGSGAEKASPAIAVTGGKLVFEGELTAQGGVFKNGNVPMQESSIYAEGGELDFRGNITLTGSLTVTGSAKLTNGLSRGTFSAESGSNANRISVEGSKNYECLGALLAEGYAFVKTDDQKNFPCTSTSMRSWSGNVTIVAHEHTWGQGTGDYFWCTECQLLCKHPGGFKTGKCGVCGMSCLHATLDNTGSGIRCTECNQIMVARIITKNNEGYDLPNYYANLVDALNAVKNNETITLLADINNSGEYAIAEGDDKTVTLDLNGKTITGGWIQVGMDRDRNNYTSSTLKIIGSGSFTTSTLSIGYKATLDLSGWTGGTITTVDVSNNGEAKTDGKLIVGENAGTIGTLRFDSRRTASISSQLSGGTYGSITISISDDKLGGIRYGDMLAKGYAFQYVDSGAYVAYGKEASYTDYDNRNIYNVKVVKCDHGGKNGFDYESGTCPYCCNASAVAQTELKGVEGNLWRNFADLQTAIDADRNGGSEFRLLTDVTGDYTIDGTQITGLNLNGHSIHGTVTVKGTEGDFITTTLSNTKNTTTASINEVVAFDGADLAGSGYPAVIGKLTLAEGATWENILNLETLGYKLLNEDGTHKWYAQEDVTGTELKNVIINSLPITSKNLSFKVDGKKLTGSKVERGTTVQLCASCNTKDAEVTIYVGEIVGDNEPTYSQKEAIYQKIGNSWYYVVDWPSDVIGKYSIYFTATKDGYTVTSKPKTLTVTKLNLSKAKITFTDGNESTYEPYNSTTSAPSFTVTYNGNTLTKGVDYTVVRGASSTGGIGTQELTIQATANGGYTGSKTAQWKIVPHKVKVSVEDVIKAYDGMATLPDGKISLVSAGSATYQAGRELPLTAGNGYELTDAKYDSASASTDEKTISFTIKLTDNNYTFEDGSKEKAFMLNGAEHDKTFKINQATVTPNEITQYVYNDLEKTYTLNLATLLPALTQPCEYGGIRYQECIVKFTNDAYYDNASSASVSKDGILILPIASANSAKVGDQIATLTVPVATTNYEKFNLTIKVVVSEKITPDQSDVTVSATDLTYGQTLAESKLTVEGTMKCPRTGNEIQGTFAWRNGTVMPDAGSYRANWVFTPGAGYKEYAPVTGITTITVKQATTTGEPGYTKITSRGRTLADVGLTAGTLSPAAGEFVWLDAEGNVLPNDTAVEANKSYTWRFIPTDRNYAERTGTITPWESSGIIIVPTYPTESGNVSNPSTGAAPQGGIACGVAVLAAGICLLGAKRKTHE